MTNVMEIVPEAIFIYDPSNKNILMHNTEFLRLVQKYAVSPQENLQIIPAVNLSSMAPPPSDNVR